MLHAAHTPVTRLLQLLCINAHVHSADARPYAATSRINPITPQAALQQHPSPMPVLPACQRRCWVTWWLQRQLSLCCLLGRRLLSRPQTAPERPIHGQRKDMQCSTTHEMTWHKARSKAWLHLHTAEKQHSGPALCDVCTCNLLIFCLTPSCCTVCCRQCHAPEV
ncbi:hypothetical protein COO60DRAFT_550479 [Scenedesmus sp. NREL 46B-D3]|nr:hypothetical protein COO60DRAFT_550479 [Scenedesmus sp. NREL 46B-D3]